MTVVPRYLTLLIPERRKQADKDFAWCREQIETGITHLIPRGVSREEFHAIVDEIYDEGWESYNDFLSMPDV